MNNFIKIICFLQKKNCISFGEKIRLLIVQFREAPFTTGFVQYGNPGSEYILIRLIPGPVTPAISAQGCESLKATLLALVTSYCRCTCQVSPHPGKSGVCKRNSWEVD